MQVTETLNEGLKRALKITIEAAELDSRVDEKLQELKGQVKLNGFRPGKVPVSHLKNMFGKQVMGEVLQETVEAKTKSALDDGSYDPATQPKIDISSFEEGKDLEYSVEFDIMPAIPEVDYKGLKLEKMVAEVSEEDLGEALDRLAGDNKTFRTKAKTAKAKKDEAVLIDFEGFVDGEAFEGGKGEDFQLVLGSGQFIPGFEDQLIGTKAGEEVEVNVTFPEEYGAAELAGKEALFKVTVKEVRAPETAELNDEFAKTLGMEDLDKLKDAMKEQMEQGYAQFSRDRLKRNLLDALDEGTEFELPPTMVEQEFDAIWGQIKSDMEQQGADISEAEKPEEELKAEYEDIAKRRVRLGLLLADIGRKNNVEVSQDDINRKLMEQARQFPGQEKMVFEYYQQNPEALAQIRAPLFEEKVVDFIIEMAEVTEKTVSKDELMADPDGEEAA